MGGSHGSETVPGAWRAHPSRVQRGDGWGMVALSWLVVLVAGLVVPIPWLMFERYATTMPIPLVAITGFGAAMLWLSALHIAWGRTRRRWSFGQSRLLLEPAVGAVGGVVRGRVDSGLPFVDEPDLTIEVRLVRRTPTRVLASGVRLPQRDVLWRRSQELRVGPSREIPGGTCGWLRVDIDPGLPAGGGDIAWELETTASLAGIVCSDVFNVPMDAGPAPDAPPVPEPALADHHPLRGTRIVCDEEIDGLTVRFPAALNPGLELLPVGVLAMLGWMGWAWWREGTWWGVASTVLAAAWVAWRICRGWLETTAITANAEGVTVTRRLLGVDHARHHPRDGISGVALATCLQSAGNAAYLRLELEGPDGGSVPIGPLLRHRRAAQLLRAELAGRMGMMGE